MLRKLIVLGIALAIVVVALILFGILTAEDEKPKKSIPQSTSYVSTQIAELNTEVAFITAFGRVVPNKKLMIYSEVAGRIVEGSKPFKVGTPYSQGQLIAKIDTRDASISLKTQIAEFKSLLTGLLPDLKLDYPNDFQTWYDYLTSIEYKGSLEPLPEVSDKQLELFLTSRRVFSTYYNIQNTELRISKSRITAPFSGTLVQAMAEVGSFIGPNQPIAELSSTGSYEVEVGLTDEELELIRVGTPVTLIDGERGKTWQSRVSRISGNIDLSTQTTKVFISISSSGLKEGDFVEVKMNGASIPNSVKIDRNAILSGGQIYVIREGKLALTQIDVVYKGTEFAYIKGVQSGDTLVVQPPSNIPRGSSVEPMPAEAVMQTAAGGEAENDMNNSRELPF
ncbi:MAG: efflux RND transporter periplasmic adaptor subunit [Candidatus Kapaibacteriales bacterium]